MVMQQSVTVLGHGYIGNHLARTLDHAGFTVFHAHHHDYPNILVGGAGIVNAAGFTGTPNVDQCEIEKAACIDGNIIWPLHLQHTSGARIIHIGSGCVYNGSKSYTEEDAPNFTGSFYSLCKSMAEKSLRPLLDKSYLLRIRMPFGNQPHPKDLLTKLRHYPRLIDGENSLTNIDDLALTVAHFLREHPPGGVYNVVNRGTITTREIAEKLRINREWFDDQADFHASVVAPRSNCTLSSAKLDKIIHLRSVHDALNEVLS